LARKKYIPSEAHLKAVEEMAHKGVSQAKMAKALGISYRTFQRHLASFDEALKKGKDRVDQEAVKREIASVRSALLDKALGFKYTETTTEDKQVERSAQKITLTKTVTKRIIPSDQAIFYYLGNRAPDEWQSVNYQREKSSDPDDEIKPLTADEYRVFMKSRTGGTPS